MGPESVTHRYYERLASGWNRWVTIAIVALLLVPLPFARILSWPSGTVLFQQLLTPWSHFRLCYVSFPEGRLVNDVYGFHWDGLTLQVDPALKQPLALDSIHEPLFKWQNRPEIPLTDLYNRGEFFQVETVWQPILLWPFRMLQESWQNGLGLPRGDGVATRSS